MITIYKLYCIHVPETVYVGATNDIKKRMKKHLASIRKYDHKNPTIRELSKQYQTDWTIEQLETVTNEALFAERENHWIEQIGTANKIRSNANFACSEKTRAKNSTTNKLVFNTPEMKAKISEMTSIAMNTPEMKAKLSAACKIAHSHPDARERNSAAQKIAQNRPEVRKRNSEAQKVTMAGRIWFNDGVKNYFVKPENAKPEWVRGPLKRTR